MSRARKAAIRLFDCEVTSAPQPSPSAVFSPRLHRVFGFRRAARPFPVMARVMKKPAAASPSCSKASAQKKTVVQKSETVMKAGALPVQARAMKKSLAASSSCPTDSTQKKAKVQKNKTVTKAGKVVAAAAASPSRAKDIADHVLAGLADMGVNTHAVLLDEWQELKAENTANGFPTPSFRVFLQQGDVAWCARNLRSDQ